MMTLILGEIAFKNLVWLQRYFLQASMFNIQTIRMRTVDMVAHRTLTLRFEISDSEVPARNVLTIVLVSLKVF